MKSWQVVPVLLGLALAGCRSDPEIALLQRDNFKKEQEIYRLRNRIEDLEENLHAGSPAQPGVPVVVQPGVMPPEPRMIEGSRSAPAVTRPGPTFTPPDKAKSEPEMIEPGPLRISPGMEAPAGEVPERLRVSPDTAPPRQIPPKSGSSSGGSTSSKSSPWSPVSHQSPVGVMPVADNSTVAQITLHPALTGGIGSGERPSDEGLLVVVEPRDFSGNIVNVPGDISVALLDPALSGEQARLARWDFAASQTQGMIRAGSQPGIHLRLPWATSPDHDRLKVFVRFTTRDGRKLQAERLIAVAVGTSPPTRPEVAPDAAPPQTAGRSQRPQWSPVR